MKSPMGPWSCGVHTRVEKQRQRLGMSRQELAQATGVRLSELKGTRSLLITSVVVLADFFGIDLAEMFGEGRDEVVAMEPVS